MELILLSKHTSSHPMYIEMVSIYPSRKILGETRFYSTTVLSHHVNIFGERDIWTCYCMNYMIYLHKLR